MKVCNRCGREIATKDGENTCPGGCPRAKKGRYAASKLRRKEREAVMRDLGFVKVRGALGGGYWE
jgi:predicted Fe-S protein YdhL (DUF1289 family)